MDFVLNEITQAFPISSAHSQLKKSLSHLKLLSLIHLKKIQFLNQDRTFLQTDKHNLCWVQWLRQDKFKMSLHEQISGKQTLISGKHFQFSQPKCKLLVKVWKYFSFNQWFLNPPQRSVVQYLLWETSHLLYNFLESIYLSVNTQKIS